MEGLSILFLLAVCLAILTAPILAWIAIGRTGRLKDELAGIQETLRQLSQRLDRLQAGSAKPQEDVDRLGTEPRLFNAEAEGESPEAKPENEPTAAVEELEKTSEPIGVAMAEVPDSKIEDTPKDPADEDVGEKPAAVAAARSESSWEIAAAPRKIPTEDGAQDLEPAEPLLAEQEPTISMAAVADKTEATEPTEEAVADASTARRSDLEQKLSTNWLVWVGGIALALAGVFLVRYIAEQGWLSPALRCAIGVVFGLSLIIAGEVVRRRPLERAIAAIRPDYVPQALTAAGLVTAFGSVYLAYAFYDLMPSGWSFITLAGITLAAFALSLVQGRFVALLGLAGAVVTPALVSTDDPSTWGFFSYLGVIVLATLAVADRKRWYWLPELSLIATAGWAALWVEQVFQDADILPIGVTVAIVALGGLILAERAGLRAVPASKGRASGLDVDADAVAWTGLILAGSSVSALAVLSDFHPTAHWLLLSFAVVAALITRLAPRFDWVLPGLALLSVTALGLVYVDDTALGNLSERLMGWPAPTEYFVDKYQKFSFHAALIAVALFVGGLQALARASQPQVVALVTGAAPLALLLIGYAQFRNYSGDTVWVWAAVATLVAEGAGTILLRRRMAARADLPGLYAAFAVIASFLALTFQFDRIWLTLAYGALVFVVAGTSMRADYSSVRRLVNLIVLIVLARLTVNPDLRGYEMFHPLGMQWVSYGYLVPLVLFVVASRMLKKARDDLTVTVLEGAALLLGIVFVSIEIRIYMTGAIYSGSYELPEASLQTIAWLTSALVLARRNLRYPRIFSRWGSRILTLAAAGQAMALQLVLMNPVFSGEFIDGYGLFNMLILSLLAPAILLWLIAGSLLPPDDKRGDVPMTILRGCSALLVFAFVTEEVRVFFQGMLIRPEHASLLELYVTTLAWLLPASAPYLVATQRATPQMRRVALAVMLVSLLMLVFGHAFVFNPVLSGETVRGWPIVNTLLLGFILPSILLFAVGRTLKGTERAVLLGGAWLLILVWVWLAIKNAFQDGQMVVLHDSLLELYITTLCWMLLAAAPFFIQRFGEMAEAKRAGYAALLLSVAMLFAGHTVLFNPVFDMSFVPGWPVFNVLLLGFIVPSALLGMIASRIDRAARPLVQVAAYVLLFIGVTMLVKQAFQGAVLTLETLSDIEDYGYSATWLMLALGTMIAGFVRDNSHVRYASLAVLLLVVLKVFLLDMSSLAGLWRVASFFGLGISLVGIGYVYQHFMYARQARAAQTKER